MVDKIVGVTENGEYVAIESDPSRDYFSMTGCTGRIFSAAQLDRLHEEWKNDTDFEDEYGHLYDEGEHVFNADDYRQDAEEELYPEGLPNETPDEKEEAETAVSDRAQELADEAEAEDRKQFFDGFADEFEWPYPFEVSYALSQGDLYATVEGCGQIDMHTTPERIMPITVSRDDLDFLYSAWKDWHLKKVSEVPADVIERVHRILDGIDPEDAIRRAAAQLGVSPEDASEPEYERPSAEEFRKTHPKTPTDFSFDPMMRRPEVHVRRHRRRLE